jgi:hypothetical protein
MIRVAVNVAVVICAAEDLQLGDPVSVADGGQRRVVDARNGSGHPPCTNLGASPWQISQGAIFPRGTVVFSA